MKYLLCIFLLASSVAADSFTLGRGSDEAQASYINSVETQTNYGSNGTMRTFDNMSTTGSLQGLFGWGQLADSTMTYDSAFVYLHFGGVTGSPTVFDFKITGLLRVLAEDEVTWDSCQVDPDGIDWTTDGADDAGTDRMSTWSSDKDCADTTSGGDYKVDVTDIANNANFNGYFLVRGVQNSENLVGINFDSDDEGTSSYRPQFVGYYTEAGATGTADARNSPAGAGTRSGPGESSKRSGP